MKKFILAAATALFAIVGCNKEQNKPALPEKEAITVTPKSREVAAEGGKVQVIVSSTGEWTLTGKEDYSSWVTPSAVKGKDGDLVTFEVKANTEKDARKAEFEFICGKAKDSFTLTSNGTAPVTPKTLKLDMEEDVLLKYTAGELRVKLKITGLDYRDLKYKISDEATSWLKYQATLEVNGGAEMVFAYDELTGLEDRVAEISVSAADVTDVKVNIVQDAKPVLTVKQPYYTVPVAGGALSVPITSNVEYEVEIEESAKSWITLGEQTETSVNFTVSALASGKRSGKVTFKQTGAEGEPLTAEITISQIDALIKWAAKLNNNRLYPKWDGTNKPGSLSNFTMEALVKFYDFNKGNGGIYSIMGIEGKFLLRMGDVGNPLKRLQIATESGNLNVPFDFEANRWYHIAVTYKLGLITVYVDGDMKGEKTSWANSINLSPDWSYESGWGSERAFWVGYSYESTRDSHGEITEVRIWNKALTKAQINEENHFYKVEPTASGLVSYWKFTEGSGDTIADATANGNKLYGEKNVRKQGSVHKGDSGIEWVEVALPEK